MLAKTIDVGVVWQVGAQTDILLLEHQWRVRSVEEHLATILALNGEREGLVDNVELKSGTRRSSILVLRAWENVL